MNQPPYCVIDIDSDNAVMDLLTVHSRIRRAQEAGGETWIGFRAGLIFRGCWHFSRGEQIPGWWGWFR